LPLIYSTLDSGYNITHIQGIWLVTGVQVALDNLDHFKSDDC